MAIKPTLLQEIEQFMYTYAAQALYKRQLYAIVKKWEDAYQQRIEELENKPLAQEFERMVSEGGSANGCECGPGPYLCKPCQDAKDEDMEARGNRYDDGFM